MAKIIELGDGRELEFPDDMPDDAIRQRVKSFMAQSQPTPQQPITGGTSLNQQPQQDGSISGGVPLSSPMAMDNPIQAGGNVQAGQVNQVNLPGTPNPNAPEPNLMDRIASSYVGGVSGALGLPGDLINFLDRDEAENNKRLGINGPTGRSIRNALVGVDRETQLPGSQYIRQGVFGAVPNAPFKSTEGKILGGAISGASSGLGFGGIPLALAGAVGGASQQGAAEAGANEYVQFGAGLLGGGLTGGAVNLAKSTVAQAAGRPSQGVVNLINEAASGVDPAKMAQAGALQEASKIIGTPLTGAEAIAQATGGNNQLQAIQRAVEQSRRGAPIMDRMMNQRVAGNDQAMQGVLGKVGQRAEDTGALGANVQEAAEKVLNNAEKKVSDRSAPLYAESANQIIPDELYKKIANDRKIQEEIKKLRSDSSFDDDLAAYGDNSIAVLNLVKMELDDQIFNLLRDGFNNKARVLQAKRDKLLSITDQVSPVYQSARATHAEGMRNIVEPLKNQPTGSLVGTGDFNKQAAILLDPKASNMTPSVAKSTIENMMKQDPQSTQTFVRQALENHFNEATQKVRGGDNQWGSANFATNILGNKMQAENLKSLFSGLPEGSATWNDFRRLMDVFEAQGKRLAPGSSTSSVTKTLDGMGEGGLVNAALQFSTVQPGSILANWYTKFRAGKNARELANLLTNPRSVEIIQQLRKIPTSSPAAAALVFTLLQGQQAANP